jgi:hypothetical protein
VSGPPETSPGAAPGHPSPAGARPPANRTGLPPWAGDGYATPAPPGPVASGPTPGRPVSGGTRSSDGWGTPGAAAGPYPAPPGGFGTAYGSPQWARKLERPVRVEWVTAAAVIGVLAVVGAALAPLWVHLAPRLAFRVDRPGRALPVVPEAEEYVGADGRFVFLTLAVGVVAGLVCWLIRRSRGPLVLLALAAGGLLGAVITWWLGTRIGTGYQPADLQQVGKIIYQPLVLRAKSALVVEPVAAVVVYLLGVGFTARNDLGQQRD